jgi:phosphoribosylformimino-5-aminoimidazole carboxamide ribonucleotide (ProFAR) isomerase
VLNLLQTTEIDLQHGGGIPELEKIQEYFTDYRIVVYCGLHCEDIRVIFDGMRHYEKRLNLLYDDVKRHYSVITSLTGAMVKGYVCRECGKGC